MKRLEDALTRQVRATNRYKKRCQRLQQQKTVNLTPRSKTRKLLRCTYPADVKVRRALTYHYALVEDIKKKYKESKEEREKQYLAQLFTGKIVKKCRMEKFARDSLCIRSRRWKTITKKFNAIHKRQKKCGVAGEKLKLAVTTFFERDDVSRSTTGKKDSITRGKVKKQKRLLSDTLKNLHQKFLAEHAFKISYTLFCSLRPFWVRLPNVNDRETCLCKMHDNLAFLANKLRQLKLLQSENLEVLANSIACNPQSKECMYGECSACQEKDVCMPEYDVNQEVFWWQWQTVREEREKKTANTTKKFMVTITQKKRVEGYLYDLVQTFQERIKNLKQHIYNIRNQYKIYRHLRDNMSDKECLIHIDFAENYLCKYGSEIQAVHFGGSHKEATLHTGVMYVGGKAKPHTFCTISDCMDHGPAAIWAYMEPVLDELKRTHEEVEVIHFFSDSPATQYRQKKNFFLFSTLLHEKGFAGGTWNFFEASHGKGAPDGVGGALKRSADKLVAQGKDIPNPMTLYDNLRPATSIKLHFVTGDAISMMEDCLPLNIQPVPQTMKTHQLVCFTPGMIHYREVSCVCSPTNNFRCACIPTKTFVFPTPNPDQGDDHVAEDEGNNPEDAGNNSEDADNNTHDAVNTGVKTDVDLPRIENWTSELVGQYCVTEYEGRPYAGIILAVGEMDVQISCMVAIGENRFFWPRREDVCWYDFDKVICIIPEPQNVTGRHKEVDPLIWAMLQRKMSLDG